MISPEDTYPGKTIPANADYPEGSIKNETVPDSSDDGTPLDRLWGNDWEGFKQAIAKAAGIVPTAPGNIPDTAIASQILQGLIELVSGRAFNYDDSGVANAYVLDVQTDQQEPAGLFDGLTCEFIVGNTNTGASTVNAFGSGIKNIVNTTSAGILTAGGRIKIRYRLGTDDWEIDTTVTSQTIAPAGFASSFHLNQNGADGGLYITKSSTGAIGFSRDAENNGTNWIAKATEAQIFFLDSAEGMSLFSDSGLTIGTTFTPTLVWQVDNTGDLIIGTVTAPSFRAYLSSIQNNITGAAKILFDTESWDTDEDYDPTTNYRYTPSVEGKYFLNATINLTGVIANDNIFLHIYKNGASIARRNFLVGNISWAISINAIVEANGSTDYFEIFVENTDRDTSDASGGTALTFFAGYQIST